MLGNEWSQQYNAIAQATWDVGTGGLLEFWSSVPAWEIQWEPPSSKNQQQKKKQTKETITKFYFPVPTSTTGIRVMWCCRVRLVPPGSSKLSSTKHTKGFLRVWMSCSEEGLHIPEVNQIINTALVYRNKTVFVCVSTGGPRCLRRIWSTPLDVGPCLPPCFRQTLFSFGGLRVSASHPVIGVLRLSIHTTTSGFTWVQRIWTQVLILAWQVLYPLNHFLRPQTAFWNNKIHYFLLHIFIKQPQCPQWYWANNMETKHGITK